MLRISRPYCCVLRFQLRVSVSSKLLRTLCVLAFAFSFCPASYAQSSTATLSGTVEDQNGALIAGASIALINIEQATQRLTTTKDDGKFVFPLLPPGRYSITCTREGFAPMEVKDVVLNVTQQVWLKIELNVGNITSQAVVVVNGASLVDKSPAVAMIVDPKLVQNLPLNGRSFQSLFSLIPGVTISKPSNFNRGQFSVNGQRTNTNNFIVDGVSANIGVSTGDTIGQEAAGSVPSLTSFGGTNNLLSVDALQEFSIQTSTYAPEFGRSPGAQISLISRSGSRDFHGTVYEYFRNEVLDANDWFSNARPLTAQQRAQGLTKQPRTPLRQNQFGGTFSGPVLLPRFGEGGKSYLSGRKSTFFFFSYEGLRLLQPKTAVSSVPSLRLRTLAPPSVALLLNAFPIPTGPEVGVTGQAPFSETFSDQSTLNATSFRIDHHFSDRFSLFGRFNYAPSDSTTRAFNNPNFLTAIRSNTQTLTVGATQIFNARTINEVRFNYSRATGENTKFLDDFGGAVPVTLSQITPTMPTGVQASSVVQFLSSNFTLGHINDNVQRQFNIVDNISYVRNNHSFKLGVDYRRLTPIFQARDYQASYVFLTPASTLAGTADFARVEGIQSTQPVFNNFSLYAQDNWQPLQRLTLTYGVRWDVNPPPSEADGRQPFVLSSDNPLTAQLAPAGTPLWKTTYNNFAPRVGFAYQLSQTPGSELILRGGAGLFYDLGNTQGGDAYTNGQFRTLATFGTGLFANVPYPLTPAQAVLPAFPTNAKSATTVGFDPGLKLPYTWQWNVTLERSLGTQQTVSAAYVAAVARRLLQQRRFASNINPNFFVLQYVDNSASSDYHALQLQFTRRLSRSFQALASYTWSHAIDDVSSEVNFELARRGNADFDVRHNFSAAFHYESPWKLSGFRGTLLRNWQSDVIVHAQSAYPFTPIRQSAVTVAGMIINVVPDVVEGVPLYLSDPLLPGGKRVNPAAFRSAPAGRQGNAGRNIVRGFPTYQFDLGLQRLFTLKEGVGLTFRVEAFNVLNHPNFGTPEPNITSIFFGQARQMLGQSLGAAGLSPVYQIGGPRSIQFSVRLGF
jgi:hypothetical protein